MPADFDVDQVAVDESLTLVVGWRSGKTIDAGRVAIHAEVADALREVCRSSLDDLAERDAKPFSADSHLEPEEYFALPVTELVASGPFIDLLRRGAELTGLAAADLPNRALLFYAAVIGDDPTSRTAYIRKTNPYMSTRRGRFFATLAQTLRRVEQPVFAFDDRIDVIVGDDAAAVLNAVAFEQLFRDLPAVLDRIPQWLADVTSHVPMSAAALEQIASRCATDSRLRRRLRAIQERGHLADVSMDDIRNEARRQGLDSKQLIRKGELVADEVDGATILKLLNEDLMTGGLSQERFSVERKSPR